MWLSKKKLLSVAVVSMFLLVSFILIDCSYAQEEEGGASVALALTQTYDDNIFSRDIDRESDLITTITPMFEIAPKLGDHKLTINYQGDYNYFWNHSSEDNLNHLNSINLKLLFSKFRIELDNRFRYFSDTAGEEDVNRIPRTQDHADAKFIFEFNKLDLTLGYLFQYENYRSDRAIGAFLGAPATYQDLDRLEHTGEVETAWKLWPKTALLFSTRFGGILHRTGGKSDSDYYDVLTGIRGEPSAKSTAEFKIGYRNQDYEDNIRSFDSVIAFGSFIENITSRDVLRLDFLRTSYDTIYQSNAYYEVSFFGTQYEHGFTERFSGNVALSYQLDSYPVETTDVGETKHRADNIWKAGCSLKYKTPKGFTSELAYEFLTRDSNFSAYDYKTNRIFLSLGVEF
ncbi:outer membrane beta-barrel protein [Candidatus Omnitrophota bacterium]